MYITRAPTMLPLPPESQIEPRLAWTWGRLHACQPLLGEASSGFSRSDCHLSASTRHYHLITKDAPFRVPGEPPPAGWCTRPRSRSPSTALSPRFIPSTVLLPAQPNGLQTSFYSHAPPDTVSPAPTPFWAPWERGEAGLACPSLPVGW